MKGEIFLTEELKANENAPKKVVRPFRRNNNRKKILNSTIAQQTATVSNEEIKNGEVKEEIKEPKRNFRRTRRVAKKDKENNANTEEKAVSVSELRTSKGIKIARDRLKIIPLGGLEEIGKNMTVFEYGNEMILVDCGVAFPEDEMLGVDLVIPDFTYLTKNKEKLKAMVITHGHEDHIGSIPYVLKEINVPIYATRLTLGLIKNKLEEHKLVRSTSMKCVKAGDVITLGNFKIEFIRVNHSIADSVALAITTPVGTVVHTGDFKIDYTPIDGKLIDLARFAELGKKGVLALMSDSTNSERPGYTMSESSVGKVFDGIFADCKKRIIVATFASNIHRVQQIVNSAMKNNRKVAICGRSMENVMNVAIELGYLDIPEGVLIDIDEIDNYAPERLTLITTGSQGEEMSGLSRMASGTHRKVTITNQDLVIISATPIPGNEKLVSNVIDDLFKIGAEVIYHTLKDIHVSGHACQEEQKLILSLVKPKYFIPVHGEFRHLQAHGETAIKVGVDPSNVIMLANGKVLELDKNFCKVTGTVPAGQILVDGLGVGDVGNIVLRDRQHLSQDGLIIVVIAMDDKTGKVMAGPDVISRGFVYVRESEDLMVGMRKEILKDIEKIQESGIKDWSTIKNTIRDTVHDFVFSKTRRNPMIIPIISEINE
jgi:ribonuclease J